MFGREGIEYLNLHISTMLEKVFLHIHKWDILLVLKCEHILSRYELSYKIS